MTGLPAVGLAAFVLTDIDDLFLLIAFFAGGALRPRQIVLGQYLGVGALIAVSAFSYLLRFVVPGPWIGLAGLVPIALGIKEALELRRPRGAEKAEEAERAPGPGLAGALSVAAVTVVNGGDNVGVYVPLFAASEPEEIVLLAAIFFGMTAVWLLLAWVMVGNRLLGRHIRRAGRYLLPLVLISLGLTILIEQRTWTLVFSG